MEPNDTIKALEELVMTILTKTELYPNDFDACSIDYRAELDKIMHEHYVNTLDATRPKKK